MIPWKQCCLGLLFSTTAYSSMPLSSGFYAGLLGTVSSAPPHNNYFVNWPTTFFKTLPGSTALLDTTLTYRAGGGGGGNIGYRARCFRLEGELLYNTSRTYGLTANNVTVTKNGQNTQGIYVHGDLNSLWGFFNFLYDFRNNTSGNDRLYSPYVGVGVGGAHQAQVSHFIDGNHTTINNTHTKNIDNSSAIQGIAGIAYEMDSQASIYLDYRYVAISTLSPVRNIHVNPGVSTVNLGITLVGWDTSYP